MYFLLGWLRSGHHEPESGVGEGQGVPGGDSCGLQGLAQLLFSPGIPFPPCNLFFLCGEVNRVG